MQSLLAQKYIAESCGSAGWILRLQGEFEGTQLKTSSWASLYQSRLYHFGRNQELELFCQDLLIPENINMSFFWEHNTFPLQSFPLNQVPWSLGDFCLKKPVKKAHRSWRLSPGGRLMSLDERLRAGHWPDPKQGLTCTRRQRTVKQVSVGLMAASGKGQRQAGFSEALSSPVRRSLMM